MKKKWFYSYNSVTRFHRPSSAVAVTDKRFGSGSGPIWMDDVICSATETRLTDCQFNNWNNTDCTHEEDVGVICPSNVGVSSSTPQPSTTPQPIVPGGGNCKYGTSVHVLCIFLQYMYH